MLVGAGRSDIAIVGVGALFADSPNSESFWQHIVRGDDLITEVPPTHWSVRDYYDPDPRARDKTYANKGSFLPSIEFNPIDYGIPPTSLPSTDTAQLLALVIAKRVLDEAVHGRFESLDRDRVSVILGVASATELVGEMSGRLQRPVWEHALRDYGMPEEHVRSICDAISSSYVAWNENTFPGLLGNVVAGRIANRLDLRGTNTVLDAACASSLSAISMAVMELQLGRTDLVISGGVDALNDIFMYMCFSKTPALSQSGGCRPFSSRADGTLLGEGIGMFALKRLEDAERDSDPIYALIKGIGSSSDGHSKSVYAPSSSGQAKALVAAHEQAGYGPETVELLEAHGTGTKAGDSAEFEGIRSVYSPTRGDLQWCALGSIKSQIGHTKAAAGAAGLFKAVMALHHKVLPPTINVDLPNPEFGIESSPFYLNTRARPWIRDSRHPRRASVSSFGFGGSNFHLTVEEYTGANQPSRFPLFSAHLFVWSAQSAAELVEVCGGLVDGLMKDGAYDLAGLSRQSQQSASANAPFRIAVVAADARALKERLEKARASLSEEPEAPIADAKGLFYECSAAPGRVAFLFPGQGSQYVEMGAAVAIAFPCARRVWDGLGSMASGEVPLHRVVFPPSAFDEEASELQAAALRRTEWAQPAIAVCSLSYLSILERLGVVPDCVGGHSFGELTALHSAGVLSESDYVSAAFSRGRLMADAAREPGAMTAVFDSADAVELLCRDNGVDLVLANYNSPVQCVVSGSVDAVEQLESVLQDRSVRYQRLTVGTAFHSASVAPAVDAFAEQLKQLRFRKPRVPVYANSTARPYTVAPSKMRALLAGQISKPVRFEQQLRAMYEWGVRTFIEVGPGSVLTGLVQQCLPDDAVMAVALDHKGQDGIFSLWSALASLWTHGVALDFDRLWDGCRVRGAKPEGSSSPLAVRINGSNYGRPYPTTLPAVSGARWNDGSTSVNRVPDAVPHPASTEERTADTDPTSRATAKENTMNNHNSSNNHHPHPDSILQTFHELQRQTAHAHAAFQQSMAQSHSEFLNASERTFLAFAQLLSGQAIDLASLPTSHGDSRAPSFDPGDTPPIPAAPRDHDGQHMPRDNGGFMPAPPGFDFEPTLAYRQSASAPAPGHVDHQHYPPAPDGAAYTTELEPASGVSTERQPVRQEPPAGRSNGERKIDVGELMLSIMSEKTGYPAEMLKNEMDLEADLGIDSIKRVEILSTMKDTLDESVEVDPQQMASLRTIGEVVDYLKERVKKN